MIALLQRVSEARVSVAGEVVGEIEVSTDFYHAFLWNEFQGMRDLNELVKNRGPYELTRARSISSSGWITGLAIDHSAGDTLIGGTGNDNLAGDGGVNKINGNNGDDQQQTNHGDGFPVAERPV